VIKRRMKREKKKDKRQKISKLDSRGSGKISK
jgi:hypothetical protein